MMSSAVFVLAVESRSAFCPLENISLCVTSSRHSARVLWIWRRPLTLCLPGGPVGYDGVSVLNELLVPELCDAVSKMTNSTIIHGDSGLRKSCREHKLLLFPDGGWAWS